MQIFLGLLGFGLLYVGGESVVRGSVALAQRLGLPRMLIGLVVVGSATSTPELLVSMRSALSGDTGIAIGNVVGSDIANLLLVLGGAAVLFPLHARAGAAGRDSVMMTASLAVLTAIAGLTTVLHQWLGVLMFLALVAYLSVSYRLDSRGKSKETELHQAAPEVAEPLPRPMWMVITTLVTGLAALLLGADWLVSGAVTVARAAGVSETVIGVTMVAVGTSLPELAAAVSAARHRHTEIVIGNVLGSNIFNTLGILGVTAAVHPIPIDGGIARFDLPFALVTAIVLTPLFWTGKRLGRRYAIPMLAAYSAYILLRFVA